MLKLVMLLESVQLDIHKENVNIVNKVILNCVMKENSYMELILEDMLLIFKLIKIGYSLSLMVWILLKCLLYSVQVLLHMHQ